MGLLRTRPARRRRALAAPFVVTAVLAPGCVTGQEAAEPAPHTRPPSEQVRPGGEEAASETQPTAAEGEPTRHRVVTNPPRPSALPPAPAGQGTWREDGGGRWTYAYADGGQVWRDADGACRYVPKPPPCPEGAMCNPPPPRAVQCPDGFPGGGAP
jgi:hypothetical protein